MLKFKRSKDSYSSQSQHDSGAHSEHFSSSSPPHSVSGYSDHSHQSRPVSSHTSTMDSQPTQPPSECEDGSCIYDPEAWFQRFHDEDDVAEASHPLPSREQLDKAASIPVYDADGVSRPFKSLYTGSEHIGQRQLIIFIRHFYCFGCSTYLQKLTETITPSAYFSLPVPTTITVIGCGMPHLIPRYATSTTCPFRIYADPTRKLHKALGLKNTLYWGKRPDYMTKFNTWDLLAKSTTPRLKAGFREGHVAGGSLTQVGGEFLFEDGEPIWCKRMKTVRDHTEMAALRRVLEMDEEVPVVHEATAVAIRPQAQQARGLKLVWDSTGTHAHLSRQSRITEEDEIDLAGLPEHDVVLDRVHEYEPGQLQV